LCFFCEICLSASLKGRGEIGDVGVDDDIKMDIEGKICDICVVIWLENGNPRDRHLIPRDFKRCFLFSKISKLSTGRELLFQSELEDFTATGKAFRACRF